MSGHTRKGLKAKKHKRTNRKLKELAKLNENNKS